MKPMSGRYAQTVEALEELYENEHGCCDQNTCGMSTAWRFGHTLWSLYLFESCGAASGEFLKLYAQLPKRFQADAERERKAFVEDVEHTECPHCNAVIWCPEEVTNNGLIYCDSCGDSHRKG